MTGRQLSQRLDGHAFRSRRVDRVWRWSCQCGFDCSNSEEHSLREAKLIHLQHKEAVRHGR